MTSSRTPPGPVPQERDRHDAGSWPSLGAGSIARDALLEALTSPELATVFAPLGFGKTTLLVQHARHQTRPVLWVTLDRHDDDIVVLVSKLVEELDRFTTIDDRLQRALAVPGASPWSQLIPRLVAAVADVGPHLLVFDDLHEVRSQEVWDVVTWLALQSPQGSQLILSGRADVGSQLARLRVVRDVLEIDAAALAFSEREAHEVLRASGLDISRAEASTIHERCEGWPAGLRLAALARRHGPVGTTPPRLSGSDRIVSAYVRSELLGKLPANEARFMLQTSVLHRLSPALCDFVLGRTGSRDVLLELERSSAFVSSLDREERWYRCHDLIRESLQAELERREPGLPRKLRRKASEWHAANDKPVEAVHYRQDSGDHVAAARMMAAYAQEQYGRGLTTTIIEWLRWAQEHDLLSASPALAMSGELVFSMHGDGERAMHFARVLYAIEDGHADAPDQSEVRAWQAIVRAYTCERGPKAAIEDAELARSLIPPTDRWRRPAGFALGMSLVMDGDDGAADERLAEFADEHLIAGLAPNARAGGLGLRARIALEQGDLDTARTFLATASEIRRLGALEGQGPQALQDALLARVAIAEGRSHDALRHLQRAQKLRSLLTWAMPGLAVITRLELARAHLALADAAGARTLVFEIQDVFHRRPDLGRLGEEFEAIRARLKEMRGGTAGATTLTGAELRLVPMLATHLTFSEIAGRLSVSENTVKSQAMSVYRKLDATSRGEAVEHAVRVGLIDPAAVSAIVFGSPDG